MVIIDRVQFENIETQKKVDYIIKRTGECSYTSSNIIGLDLDEDIRIIITKYLDVYDIKTYSLSWREINIDTWNYPVLVQESDIMYIS